MGGQIVDRALQFEIRQAQLPPPLIGTARQALGDNATAAEAFRKALKADPNHRQANFLYGRYLAIHEQAYAEAIDHMKRALDSRGFLDGEMREVTMMKLRRLFGRARPNSGELKIMHTIMKLVHEDGE